MPGVILMHEYVNNYVDSRHETLIFYIFHRSFEAL